MTSSPPAPERPNTRITHADHFADIVINRDGPQPIYYWIVQRNGSADIVAWGQEESFAKAEESVRDWLRTLTA